MNYNKEKIEDKKNMLASPKIRKRARHSLFLYKYLLLMAIAIVVVCLGAGFGFVRGILNNAPQLSLDSIHKSSYTTVIFDNEKQKTSSISNQDAEKNYKKLESLPSDMQNAFIAIEDTNFYSHSGVGLYQVAKDVLLDFQTKNKKNKRYTITTQLVQNNILGDEYESSTVERLERKIQEQYLSFQLEKIASKQTILEEYLNTVNLGERTTGVQAASKKYFNKNADSLTLSESAVLAALVRDPARYNPFTHPDANASRRLIVLQNMLEQHYITKSEYKEALNDNVYERLKKISNSVNIAETGSSDFENALILQVAEDLQTELGYDESTAYSLIYNGGLKIYSTQDSDIQTIAERVTQDDSNYPESSKVSLLYSLVTVSSSGTEHTYSEKDVLDYMKQHDMGKNLLFSNKNDAEKVVNAFENHLKKKKESIETKSFHVSIQPQVSMSIINQQTGNVEALIGGRETDANSTNLNRSVRNTEQPGSNFSILSTFLPALDRNQMTLATVFDDAPYRYIDTNEEVHNNYKEYQGYSSIRDAITNSMNVVAAKAMTEVTPITSYQYLKDLGFTTLVDTQSTNKGKAYSDVHQALSLGQLSNGITNLELTNAYATIANEGISHSPKFYTRVVDRHGNILLDNKDSSEQVIKSSTAFLLTDALQDSISTGSSSAGDLKNPMPCAGSSGISLSGGDAWFSGFTPYHTASVWVGYDTDTTFSSENAQAKIWKKIMDEIITTKKEKIVEFSKPSNVVKAKVCKVSGKLAIPGVCDHDPRGNAVTTEFFTLGSIPTETCDLHTKVTLCKDTHQIATKNCPNTYERVYLVRPEYRHGKTKDSVYELPNNLGICKEHSHS